MAPNTLNLMRETPRHAQVRPMQADNLSPKCGAPQIFDLVAHFEFLLVVFFTIALHNGVQVDMQYYKKGGSDVTFT